MNDILAVVCSFFLNFIPAVVDTNSGYVSIVSTGSVSVVGLTTKEAEVIKDENFRYFVVTLAEIEDNYRRAGTLDTKKMMSGALRGVLKYGTGDAYSKFIPEDEIKDYMSKDFGGENKTKDGTVIENVSVIWKTLKHGAIGYVRVSEFRDSTIRQFDKAVEFLISKKPKALIVDLRDNPGGMNGALHDVMCYLVPSNQVLAKFEQYRRGAVLAYPARDISYRIKKTVLPVNGFEFLRGLPKIVLMNGGTASAGEIMATALRDAGAKLLGQKSFGKGIYQAHIHGFLGMSKMTMGRWLTTSGECIDGKGIRPDYEVLDTRGLDEEYDAQLHEAIKLLSLETSVKHK